MVAPPPASSRFLVDVVAGNQRGVAQRLTDDWQGLAADLARIILQRQDLPPLVRMHHDQEVDLAVHTADQRLAPMPWELAAPYVAVTGGSPPTLGYRGLYRNLGEKAAEREELTALQVALWRVGMLPSRDTAIEWAQLADTLRAFQAQAGVPPDGVAGPATWRALNARLTQQVPSASRSVLVLKASVAAERRASRGTTIAGQDLVGQYASHGFAVEVVEDPSPARLDQFELGALPSIVHISAALAVTPSTITLEFASREGRDPEYATTSTSDLESTGITPTVLDRFLQRWPVDGRPLVILDIARPSTPTETARQWLARNQFCHQLFTHGNTPTLLGMGFIGPYQGFIYQALIEFLAKGGSAGDITPLVAWLPPNTPSPPRFEDAAGLYGMAFFSICPPLTLPPVILQA